MKIVLFLIIKNSIAMKEIKLLNFMLIMREITNMINMKLKI